MTDSTYTHLAVVADRSGSMQTIEKDMNEGLKAFLDEQAKGEGSLKVDITVFDWNAELVLKGGSVDQVEHPVIHPRGGTALNDAIGLTVTSLGERLARLPEDERPGKVIVLIITDGGENASKEYTISSVKTLVERQQTEYSWEFIFLGANIDAFSVAGGYGIANNSTLQYVPTAAGASASVAAASAYVTRTRGGETFDGFTTSEREDASGASTV